MLWTVSRFAGVRGAKDWKAYMRDSGSIRLLFAYPSISRLSVQYPSCSPVVKLSGEVISMAKKKKSDLKERLERYRQIKLTVIGRKSRQEISNPVWFVFEGEKLYLLPVHGSDTQWYSNILENQSMNVDARCERTEHHACPDVETEQAQSIVEQE